MDHERRRQTSITEYAIHLHTTTSFFNYVKYKTESELDF